MRGSIPQQETQPHHTITPVSLKKLKLQTQNFERTKFVLLNKSGFREPAHPGPVGSGISLPTPGQNRQYKSWKQKNN